MKRCSIDGSSGGGGDPTVSPREEKNKRPRSAEEELDPASAVAVPELGEDVVLEVLKRAEARTVGRAACVSRRWRRLAEDERLWEAVCTRDWVKVPCGKQQLRTVVLALGGFRRLYSVCILPFLDPPGARRAAASPDPALPAAGAAAALPRRPQPRWGKDEVQLSLALLSIGFFEKMNPNNCRGNSNGNRGSGCG